MFRLGRIFIIKMRSCLKIQKGQKPIHRGLIIQKRFLSDLRIMINI
nr:MAG TPA: hypothetical protein [Caudoviricetes sp.]